MRTLFDMEKNEASDSFGKVVIENVFDDNLIYLKQVMTGTTKWETGKEYTEVFKKLNARDR